MKPITVVIFGLEITVRKAGTHTRRDDLSQIFKLDESQHQQAVAQIESDYDLSAFRDRAKQFKASIA